MTGLTDASIGVRSDGSPLRILHLITNLDHGGAERTLVRLVKGVQEVRHLVVCLGDAGALAGQVEAAGTRVIALGGGDPAELPRVLGRLWRLVRDARPDVIQTWMYHADVLGGLVGRGLGIPVVWNVRTTHLQPSERLGTRVLVRIAAGLSRVLPARVVYNSRAGQVAHRAMGFDLRTGVVIVNGVPVPHLAVGAAEAARAGLGVQKDALVVGRVARYAGVKDFPTLLHAVGLVREEVPAVRLVLVGRRVGQDNMELRRLLEQTSTAQIVHLLGERDDLSRVYPAFDVLCSTSTAEGFPNTLAEAMSYGVPVVATDVGDTPDIVGDTGVVVAPQDPVALAAALVTLLGDEDERRRRGQAARARIAEQFSEAAMARQYLAMYRQVAA